MIGKTNAISGVSDPVPKIRTVSGSVISISDALAQAAESFVADINAVQSGSGDPSPSNVRPISGWDAVKVTRTGKNLIDDSIKEISGSNLYVGNLHAYTISLKAGTYTFSVQFASGVHYSASIREKNDSANTALWSATSTTTEKTFTLPKDGLYRLWMAPKSGETVATTGVVHAQIELGSATAYEPYNGNTYTIQLGQTVYGGSLNVTTGVLTVDSAMVDLGTLTWVKQQAEHFMYSTGIASLIAPPATNDTVIDAKCTALNVVSANAVDVTSGALIGVVTSGNIRARFDGFPTTASAFKTAVSGWMFCYPLATSQTVQLSPTTVQMLLGNNVLWADSGDSELQYWARR